MLTVCMYIYIVTTSQYNCIAKTAGNLIARNSIPQMFSMSVDRVLLNQVRSGYVKNQKTLPPRYLFLISIFCFVRLLLLFHNQDTNSSSAPSKAGLQNLPLQDSIFSHNASASSRIPGKERSFKLSESRRSSSLVVSSSSSSSSAASIGEAVVYGSTVAQLVVWSISW